MSSLTSTSAIFRIDPTNALVEYVNSIKPYHTKVLDVFVEYIYGEPMNVTVSDRMSWTFGMEPTPTLLSVISANIAAKTLTLSLEPVDLAPKLSIGDTFTFKQSPYYDGTFTFTIAGLNYSTDNKQVVVTVSNMPTLEGKKQPSDRLSNAAINQLIVQGVAAFNEPERQPVVYTCGFGYVWDLSDPGSVSTATITHATGTVSQQVLAIASNVITLAADSSGFTYSANTPVVFSTTGTFPTGIQQGGLYYATPAGTNMIQISETPGGAVIALGVSYTGVLTAKPQDTNINTFVVTAAPSSNYAVSVSNLDANQLAFTHAYNIVGVSPASNSWVLPGNLLSHISAGDNLYVNNNTDPTSNKTYLVLSASYNSTTDQTTVFASTPVSAAATVSGQASVDVEPTNVPSWPTAAAVKVTTTGTHPTPITGTSTYYFVPTPKYGVFNLSNVRYPTKYDDIVDLTTLGTGNIAIHRTEPFIPGDRVTVSGSVNGNNDGTYIVKTIVSEGSGYRVSVYQNVSSSTPVGMPTDGTMSLDGSFGDPFCTVASADKMHVSVVFAERLQFDFGDDTDTVPNEDTPQFDVQPFM